MKGIWIKEEMMSLMYEILKNLPNLIKLVIPYIANDDVLLNIKRHQKNLLYLDISGESDITDIGIDYLCSSLTSKTLTVVDIGMLGEENIDHVDIASLLTHIPNLTSLGCYSFVGKALQYIIDNINPSFISKLQYLHDTGTMMCTMNAICSTCPHLKHLYIDSPEPNILTRLTSLRNLERLKIYRFKCEDIVPVFKCIGSQFRHVTLMKGRGIMDVTLLIHYCPNLIDLDFYMMDELTCTTNEDFKQLRSIEMLNCPMSSTTLRHLICNCHQTIRRLAVDVMPFTETEMARYVGWRRGGGDYICKMHRYYKTLRLYLFILSHSHGYSILLEYDFNKLEDIWFTSASNFTMATIELLLLLPELLSIGMKHLNYFAIWKFYIFPQ